MRTISKIHAMLVTGMFISQAMHHFGAGKIHLFKHLIGVTAMKATNGNIITILSGMQQSSKNS
jgi:hypothetical protein